LPAGIHSRADNSASFRAPGRSTGNRFGRALRDRSGAHAGFHIFCRTLSGQVSYTSIIIGSMLRTHLFFKVEIEHDDGATPGKIGEEIGRHLRKLYVVRSVELSSVVTQPE